MITPELKEAIALLKAWTKREAKCVMVIDGVEYNQESPLMHNTKKFIESVEQVKQRR